MAEVPTDDALVRRILDEFKNQNRKAGEIINYMNLWLELGGNDLTRGTNAAASLGYIEATHSKFLKLTEAGFRAM